MERNHTDDPRDCLSSSNRVEKLDIPTNSLLMSLPQLIPVIQPVLLLRGSMSSMSRGGSGRRGRSINLSLGCVLRASFGCVTGFETLIFLSSEKRKVSG
jgi:hypothetical protein